MISDIPLSKDDIIAHLVVKGTASTGPSTTEFEKSDWLDQTTRISVAAGAGSVIITPLSNWGGTEYTLAMNNSYSSAQLTEVVWNE